MKNDKLAIVALDKKSLTTWSRLAGAAASMTDTEALFEQANLIYRDYNLSAIDYLVKPPSDDNNVDNYALNFLNYVPIEQCLALVDELRSDSFTLISSERRYSLIKSALKKSDLDIERVIILPDLQVDLEIEPAWALIKKQLAGTTGSIILHLGTSKLVFASRIKQSLSLNVLDILVLCPDIEETSLFLNNNSPHLKIKRRLTKLINHIYELLNK